MELFFLDFNPVSNSVGRSATHICESPNSSKQSKEEITREEIVAGGASTHGHRQQVQSPKFGFDAEVASASAAAAAAALLVTKGSVLLGQFPFLNESFIEIKGGKPRNESLGDCDQVKLPHKESSTAVGGTAKPHCDQDEPAAAVAYYTAPVIASPVTVLEPKEEKGFAICPSQSQERLSFFSSSLNTASQLH